MQRLFVGTVVSALLMAGAATLPAAATPNAPAASPKPPGEVLVVDDDRQECAQAEYTSIQDAVEAASAGALVRVCPGIYTGLVKIDKPLSLIGQRSEVGSLDCFSSATPQADDPTTYAILNRPQGTPGNLLTVAAGGVTVAGLVLQGATTVEPEAPQIEDAALHLKSGSAGTRVHHNLIRQNSLGIDLGSDGSAATRVDHNCVRDNRWGMASQRQDFVGATVDHNETFRQEIFGYEIGWPRASTRDAVFAHNVSREDGRIVGGASFFVQNSSNISIADNDAEPINFGVQSRGGNTGLTVTGNRIVNGAQVGVVFQALPGGVPSDKAVVTGNTISDFGPSATGFGISLASIPPLQGSVHDVLIQDNVLTGNVRGVNVNPSNTGVVVRANLATGNQFGIYAVRGPAGSTYGHVFERNTMLGNAVADARDDTRDAAGNLANTWIGNVCQIDDPPGKICGVG